VGNQKGDVKTAGKETQMQQDIAAVGESLADGLLQGLAAVVGMDGMRSMFAAGQPPRNRQNQDGNDCPNIKCSRPADVGQGNQTLNQRSEQKLPCGPACIDQAGSQAAPMRRRFGGDLSHNDGKSARTRTECQQ